MGRRPKNHKSAAKFDRIDQVINEGVNLCHWRNNNAYIATKKTNEMLHRCLGTSDSLNTLERHALLNGC